MNKHGQNLWMESSQRNSLQRSKQGHKDKSNSDKHSQRTQSTNRGSSRETPHTHFPIALSRKNKEVFREPAHCFSSIFLVSSSSAEIRQHCTWIQMPSILVTPHPSPLDFQQPSVLTSPLPWKWTILYARACQSPLNWDLQQESACTEPKFTPQCHAFILQSGYLWLLLLPTWQGLAPLRRGDTGLRDLAVRDCQG